MVGRKRKSDVKSRLGKTYLPKAKPKTGRIRDARDVLKKKGSLKVTYFLVHVLWWLSELV